MTSWGFNRKHEAPDGALPMPTVVPGFQDTSGQVDKSWRCITSRLELVLCYQQRRWPA